MRNPVAAETKSKSTAKKETEKKVAKTKKADSKAKKASTTKSGTAKPVNINKADAKELATLDGIGEERAKNIVSYRKKMANLKSRKIF